MNRMNQGTQNGLMSSCYLAWFKILDEAKKEGMQEKQLLEAKEAMKNAMKEKSKEARKVMERMGGNSSTGVLYNIFIKWAQCIADLRENKEVAERLDKRVQEGIALQKEYYKF